jgi:hypothetical protein
MHMDTLVDGSSEANGCGSECGYGLPAQTLCKSTRPLSPAIKRNLHLGCACRGDLGSYGDHTKLNIFVVVKLMEVISKGSFQSSGFMIP